MPDGGPSSTAMIVASQHPMAPAQQAIDDMNDTEESEGRHSSPVACKPSPRRS
jgi:hypothetical protein